MEAVRGGYIGLVVLSPQVFLLCHSAVLNMWLPSYNHGGLLSCPCLVFVQLAGKVNPWPGSPWIPWPVLTIRLNSPELQGPQTQPEFWGSSWRSEMYPAVTGCPQASPTNRAFTVAVQYSSAVRELCLLSSGDSILLRRVRFSSLGLYIFL